MSPYLPYLLTIVWTLLLIFYLTLFILSFASFILLSILDVRSVASSFD